MVPCLVKRVVTCLLRLANMQLPTALLCDTPGNLEFRISSLLMVDIVIR